MIKLAKTVVILLLIGLFSGCGAKATEYDALKAECDQLILERNTLQEELESLRLLYNELKDQQSVLQAKYDALIENKENGILPSGNSVVIGDIIEAEDVCGITFSGVRVSNEITTANRGRLDTLRQENENLIYVDIAFDYTNLRVEPIDLFRVGNAKLICGGKYEYDAEFWIEFGNRGMWGTNIQDIDPLVTGYAHAVFSVPIEFAKTGSEMKAVFSFDGIPREVEMIISDYEVIIKE